MCFYIVRREIAHIRLQSIWKCTSDIYWSDFTVSVKGSIKSFQSIRFRLRKESTLASFKAVRGKCEERLSKAASICSPLSRVV